MTPQELEHFAIQTFKRQAEEYAAGQENVDLTECRACGHIAGDHQETGGSHECLKGDCGCLAFEPPAPDRSERCECGRLGLHPYPIGGGWALACDECKADAIEASRTGDPLDEWSELAEESAWARWAEEAGRAV